jgi:hypothetical protein
MAAVGGASARRQAQFSAQALHGLAQIGHFALQLI